MTKLQRNSLVVSAVLSVLIVGGAVAYGEHTKNASAGHVVAQRPVSQSELARSDGKNGNPCLVAVDGIVYKIQDFALWHDGKHTSSNGLAYCGADLSKVIDQAPHGRSKLDVLIKVGPLAG